MVGGSFQNLAVQLQFVAVTEAAKIVAAIARSVRSLATRGSDLAAQWLAIA